MDSDKSNRVEYLKHQRERMRSDLDLKRQQQQQQQQKQKQAKDAQAKHSAQKFITKEETVEAKLKLSTIGLVHLEDFQRIKGEIEEERLREAAQTLVRPAKEKKEEAEQDGGQGETSKPLKRVVKKKAKRPTLSFDSENNDDDDEEIKLGPVIKKRRKNPMVDTSFLPDKDREEEEARLREELRQKWLRDQDTLKQQPIDITYSYWDGSGHRKQVRCRKGDTIAQFLDKCKAQVPELRSATVDGLVYVKEDLIIPHHYSFYDFIVNKARGKSGPLFSFDVHDDVRLTHDATVEKDDSHAGKVCERAWYERNKHIFPANRWETFDPEKNYGSYTIRDTKQGSLKK
ncbi:alpha-1,6- mannosyltransferase [Kickxella alabastrina]|uniref:Alpha-1,6- mannosyltransferase n=1 Tax=Kickxella alabastrina TaxID=61397 RepID=A0ACC1ID89_9FUNG|nr:alpha-1,6- mannosyltransferase [Kickxella alabastrina]